MGGGEVASVYYEVTLEKSFDDYFALVDIFIREYPQDALKWGVSALEILGTLPELSGLQRYLKSKLDGVKPI